MLLSITSHNFNLVIQLLILFVSHPICSLRIVKSSLCWIILILRLWIKEKCDFEIVNLVKKCDFEIDNLVKNVILRI